MVNVNTELFSETAKEFSEFLKTEGQDWEEEREEKDKFIKKYFSKEKLPNLDEGTLRQLIHNLWAFSGWTNKDYLLQEMLTSGLDTIRKAFDYLLYSDDQISKRFDFIQNTVRMMGAAVISEILAHHDHKKYPIWNRRSKAGLIALGIPSSDLPKSTQISGAQYQSFCDLVNDVLSQITTKHPEFEDMFTLDFILYYISQKKTLKPVTETEKEIRSPDDFDHGDIIDKLLELGDGLGFEVKKEFKVTHGCKIDAIWQSRIANLGTISYAFEVHRKGNRDSAILNLQKVKKDPSIQKVVVVSTEDELKRFKDEIADLSEDFRNSVGYFEVNDLLDALNHLESMKETLKHIGLLSVESFLT